MACSWISWKYSTPFGWSATFSWPLMSLWTRPKTSAWRWLLVACFSSVKNHNVSGPHLFPSFTTHAKKIPLPPLGRSYTEQFRTLFLPHRFIKIRPSHQRVDSDPSGLNFWQFVGFQNFPNLSKIEKVAETCEFDGKEPRLFQRATLLTLSPPPPILREWEWEFTGNGRQDDVATIPRPFANAIPRMANCSLKMVKFHISSQMRLLKRDRCWPSRFSISISTTFSSTHFLTPVAVPIFETKNRAIFLESFFGRGISGEALLPLQLCSH